MYIISVLSYQVNGIYINASCLLVMITDKDMSCNVLLYVIYISCALYKTLKRENGILLSSVTNAVCPDCIYIYCIILYVILQ
jgi:hypothetical protein